MNRDAHSHLPLTHLSFHILLAVAEQDLHGYAIVQAVEALSGGALTPGTGTFYSAIHRLQGDALLAEVNPPPDADRTDARRRYYRLTALGRRVLAAETERLAHLVLKARAVPTEVAG